MAQRQMNKERRKKIREKMDVDIAKLATEYVTLRDKAVELKKQRNFLYADCSEPRMRRLRDEDVVTSCLMRQATEDDTIELCDGCKRAQSAHYESRALNYSSGAVYRRMARIVRMKNSL